MNQKCNLTKRVRVGEELRYCPVVEAPNGRIKPDVVFVDGKQERHPEGSYYLDWHEGSKRVRLSVGKDPQDAFARKKRKEIELNAANNGISVQPEKANSPLLDDAIREFLEEKQAQRKAKTHSDYETTLGYFRQSCKKQFLSDITRKDLISFSAYCRDELELSPRTVFNKFARVVAFLKAHKIKVHETGDAPRFVEEEPEIYEREDLDALFASCDVEERLWFEFFLCTGMREQEVMHTYWKDVNLKASTVRVTYKPDLGWTPKAYKEREIPIPTKLVRRLKSAKAKANGCPLLFPTAGCRPKLDFLDRLKACAERAELRKEDFWLHKFRATFATWSLWAGVDLRTVQSWLGHSDIESTMRYLKPSRSKATAAKVNEIFA